MVVSKDSKRKRKESPPPPPQQQPSAVESSPEMPKRTKVQAQRKFAQGQSAPASSYNPLIAASSSSNTGPSTSSESREPPTEILPNKRPKTEDFLTFLCFRGTSALPAHLDFLNQGKSKETEATAVVKKNVAKQPTKTAKKGGKKGRAKAAAKNATSAAAEPKASTSTAAAAEAATVSAEAVNKKEKITLPQAKTDDTIAAAATATEKSNDSTPTDDAAAILPFAVRKRAEVVAEGNRRSRATDRQLRNAADAGTAAADKCNNSPESKRRSNRTSTKGTKSMVELETDEENEEEYFSANDEEVKIGASDKDIPSAMTTKYESKNSKTPPVPPERKSETPSKESDTGKAGIRKGKGPAAASAKKGKEAPKESTIDVANKSSAKESQKVVQKSTEALVKEKPPPVKRPRQKESPIFIPSPEPSGRMTRQRAFFEPVKVPHRVDDNAEEGSAAVEETVSTKKDALELPAKEENTEAKDSKVIAGCSNKSKKTEQSEETSENAEEMAKSNINIFDFSSDDEQPLSKAIKIKKSKANPKKPTAAARNNKQGRKLSPKKVAGERKDDIKIKPLTDDEPLLKEMKIDETPSKIIFESEQEVEAIAKNENTAEFNKNNKNKRGSGKNLKKKMDEKVIEDNDIAPPSPKKSTNVSRQSRKKPTKAAAADNSTINGGEDDDDKIEAPSSSILPNRSQRPSRKTKEAAAIYMGIIGQKLALPDDEDDDQSLNSFPDLPNVKEMEKMEIELKKNASAATATAVSAAVAKLSTDLSPNANKTLPKQLITGTTTTTIVTECPSLSVEKPPTAGRRGRPPKQPKPAPVKREIEGMLVKKGALSKLAPAAVAGGSYVQHKDISEVHPNKVDSEDEDFLINEELNETKRNLEKSFSDSDDEPLAIKVNVKATSDKDAAEQDSSRKSDCAAALTTSNIAATAAATTTKSTLAMLPLTAKTVATPAPLTVNATTSSPPVITAVPQQTPTPPQQAPPSPFKTIEKKSPVPTSKILNVPATYAIPNSAATNSSIITAPSVNIALNANFNKSTSYLPQASPHYHTSQHIRPSPAVHQFSAGKASTSAIAGTSSTSVQHLTAPPPPQLTPHAPPAQSPLKYQTPPTTYPPPIEAYPSPKINPNFLTPKFDRTSLPRSNNFPSPSPVKFDMSGSKMGLTANSTPSPKNPTGMPVTSSTLLAAAAASTSSAIAAANSASADPLKDEIGSILAQANLMPSKEESGKIFGIASVSLAQSSGPDNTKCTLGKCGSIHKPVLGPVVPTEGYIGDQLSSKERRKAKVNMTHEQIQKWLIECSSNPDEIQDDLDDDFDDNLRPNLFATTPPPTRDDKESTSFSSSSKATRDLGKSESAWSAKGPSLKATPVVATSNRKDDGKPLEPTATTTINNQPELVASAAAMTPENDKTSCQQAVNLTHKSNIKQNSNVEAKATKAEKADKKAAAAADKKPKEDKSTARELTSSSKDHKQNKSDKDKDTPTTSSSTKVTVAGKQSNTATASATQNQQASLETPSTSKHAKRKNIATAIPTSPVVVVEAKSPTSTSAQKLAPNSGSNTSSAVAKTPKRTPVYNQKALKQQIELKETTTTSHKKTAPFSYGAFSADNEKSIYSFDKDDDDIDIERGTKKPSPMSKPNFRRQSQRDTSATQEEMAIATTPTTRASPTKKRAAATAADKANKDIANASQSSSVSLTLSPSENCKQVKVSLDADKTVAAKASNSTSTGKANRSSKKTNEMGAVKKEAAAAAATAADSDSDGQHTFYIPLQGSGTGGDAEGGIQGVAVKLGREGPDGPNQKVIMHATLVTKAQMGSNSKPLPDSMNVSDIVKTLTSTLSSSGAAVTMSVNETTVSKKGGTNNSNTAPSTSAAAAAATAASNSASNSLKNVPIGTVQPRFKGSEPNANAAATATSMQATTSAAAGGSGLVRVNSNSSLFSGSAKSRIGGTGGGGAPGPSNATVVTTNKKFKDDTPIKMSNNTAFPRHDDPTQMVEAPIFRPTEKEFADPIEFIERITPIAARFGICKIIPPATFKPECRISDEMRFTAYNQYVHKMLHRWGPSAKELSAIKKYLATQTIVMNHPPWIGGMEVDLPRLYHTVQELGGLKEVIEKKKWARVAEEMCIPKLAQDRVTKLDDIYCKYLLPYDTLSPAERQKLFDEVEADWAKREARARRNADRFVNTESVSNEEDDVSSEDDDESEEEVDGVSMECIVKGRSMPLSQFYRIARNTMALWFKNTEPTVNEVEAEFWRHVAVRDSHVCVHSGSIDSSGWGYGFPSPGPKGKGSNYARHLWNLKVLTNNPGSVLRSLGPVMGVTVPTLHVGMLFSACCWYRDPHGLSWIEYLHTGASKLWYGIPDDQSANFRAALTSLIPTHCQNKTIWLPCDTVMVPPHMLTDRGVSLCRIEQKPGEFIVVFPRAYTSSLATGYVVSESVYFATTSWLDLAKDDFRDIHDSCEPAMFSLEQLLFALGYDQRVTSDTLQQMLPMLHEVFEKEAAAREQLKAAGVTSTEKVHNEKGPKAKKQQPPFKSIESECDLCRANLYISMVRTEDGNVYCLQHALKNLNNGNIQAKQCKLIYAYNVEDIENLIKNLKDKIQHKLRNAVVSKRK